MKPRILIIVVLLAIGVLLGAAVTGGLAQGSSGGAARVTQYAVVLVDTDGNLNLQNGSAPLTVQGLVGALEKYPGEGWQIYSIIPFVSGSSFDGSGSTNTSFTVILVR